ncbi:MAG: glycosyltransferase family 4 protein [Oceanospirillales bacterium]|nr:glycosyltransferase family 4 protein [Oceanospirillales bacterium]
MKLLVLSNMYPSENDPVFGVYVRNFIDGLVDLGIIVDKVVIPGRKRGFNKVSAYIFYTFQSIIKIYKSDYDVIYIHSASYALIPLIFAKFMIRKPYVINAHGTDLLCKSRKSKFIRFISRNILNEADILVFPSESYFKETNLALCREKVFISPSGGIGKDFFSCKIKNYERDELTLGYVSRIDKGKGCETFISSLKILREKKPSLKFRGIIVGDGDSFEEMKLLSKKMNLDDSVSFTGKLSQKTLIKIYPEIQIFVFPTRLNESLGLVGLEAMAAGVPVIGSNIGALPEYISDGFNGYLFSPGSPDELCDKILGFLDLSHAERHEMIRNSMYTARRYESEMVLRNLLEALQRVLL